MRNNYRSVLLVPAEKQLAPICVCFSRLTLPSVILDSNVWKVKKMVTTP